MGCEGVDWIQVAQGVDYLRAVVNTRMNLFVPYMTGQFLTPWTIFCAPRKNLLHGLVTYDYDRYTTGGRSHIASSVCIDVGYVCYLVCSVTVLSFVTVLEHMPVLLQVRADRTVRKYICNYLQKSEAHVRSDILTQHWITV
jgi:hypothetical protein